MLQALLSGALLGLTSVPHCAAMCGPLAAFACSRSTRRDSPLRYQLGRTLGYGVAGAVAGHAGRALLHVLSPVPAAARFILFATLAASACLLVARTLLASWTEAVALVQLGSKPRARSLASTLLQLAPADPGAFGMLSVFLPCGVLGAALLVAAASGDARSGASAMVGFATSSGVALFAAGALVRAFRLRAPTVARRIAALALVVAAVVLMIKPVFVLIGGTPQSTGASAPHCH